MRSRRVSEPQLSRKEPEEPHLHRRSSNPRCHFRHRGGASRDTGAHELLRGSQRHAHKQKKRLHHRLLHSPLPCVCVCVTTAVLIYIRVMVGGLFAAWRTTWIPTYLLHFTFRTQNQFGSAALCDTQRAALVFWMRREDRKLTPSPTGRTVSRSPF